MPEAYSDAALRHYQDAERLADEARYDNAGHLIGFAAECALKHHFKLTAAADSPRTHLPDLAATIRKRFSARNPQQAPMRNMLDLFGSAFFAQWDVSGRYEATGTITEQRYAVWRDHARRTLGAAGIRPAAGA